MWWYLSVRMGWGGGGGGWSGGGGGGGLLCRFMGRCHVVYIILTLRESYTTSCAVMKIGIRRRNNYIEESVGM